MNNQLSNIAIEYRKFSRGQYIEEPEQFNEFLDHFEDEDRLSKVMLQGVGIVCGFEPQLIYGNEKNRALKNIRLSQGVGITTDGDLLTLENIGKEVIDLYVSTLKTINLRYKEYTHYKTYDNYKAVYPAFHNGTAQITLYELATATEAKTGFLPVSGLTQLEDKYLVLYLENYEKDIKPCRGVDCDNHGKAVFRNLKVLLTNSSGLARIRTVDTRTAQNPDLIPVYYGPLASDLQTHIKLKRLILQPVPTTPEALRAAYKDIVETSNYTQMHAVIDTISMQLGIDVVDRSGFHGKITTVLGRTTGFQYAYAAVRDLIDTYTEIIDLLPRWTTRSLPNVAAFPKHLLLGKLVKPTTNLGDSRYPFFNSPVLDGEKIDATLKLLVARYNQQTLKFVDTIAVGYNTIHITPSKNIGTVGQKAIPFYYYPLQPSAADALKNSWNYKKTSYRDQLSNLVYGSGPASASLSYKLDTKTFFLVEGMQGKSYQTAISQIREIRDSSRLPFEVMGLSLKKIKGNKDMYIAYFSDYVEKHPGLEHRGGAPEGGTLFLVFDEKNEVVADFSLPYICCTPKSNIQLSLPSATACANAARMPFTVSPLNGVVRTYDAAYSSSVTFENGQYYFNPSAIAPINYNEEIEFTVNGILSDCSIKVKTQPDLTVEVTNIVDPEAGSNYTSVTFTITGDNLTDYSYEWDFLGNNGYVVSVPAFVTDKDGKVYGKVTYRYVNLKREMLPKIGVKVSGNGCAQVIPIQDWHPATLTIEKIDFLNGDCCEDIK